MNHVEILHRKQEPRSQFDQLLQAMEILLNQFIEELVFHIVNCFSLVRNFFQCEQSFQESSFADVVAEPEVFVFIEVILKVDDMLKSRILSCLDLAL